MAPQCAYLMLLLSQFRLGSIVVLSFVLADQSGHSAFWKWATLSVESPAHHNSIPSLDPRRIPHRQFVQP